MGLGGKAGDGGGRGVCARISATLKGAILHRLLVSQQYALAARISRVSCLKAEYKMNFDSSSSYTEDPVKVAAVRSLGAWCWVILGVFGFMTLLVLWVPVEGVTDIPRYARSVLFLSLSHHLDDVQRVRGDISPPPPSFRL